MQNRTQKTTAYFSTTFSFTGSSRRFPPGDYIVVEDQELIEGNSRLGYRRKATFIQFPAIGTPGPKTQLLEVDHGELTALLNRDLQNQADHKSDVQDTRWDQCLMVHTVFDGAELSWAG